MTRDEAIKAFRNSTPDPSSLADSAWIDRFVALGMLKLDEPKTGMEKLSDIVRKHAGRNQAQCIMNAVINAGLRIEET